MNQDATVYVVDDDPSVRKGLSRLITSVGFNVAAFASAREFLDTRKAGSCPKCVVLDVRMPGLSGLDMQEELTKRGKYIMPIIFISGHGDIPMTVRAMKGGAVDFLAKPFNDQDLLDAINVAIDKDRVAREALSEVDELMQRVDRLTPRERQVMALVITGMLNKQIAYDLGISEKTVKVHRGHVMEKLEIDSVAELVRLAQKVGVEPGDIGESP